MWTFFSFSTFLKKVMSKNVLSCENVCLRSTSFVPPTNEASSTLGQHSIKFNKYSAVSEPLLFPFTECNLPWLPVSKGSIKKTAQTRFVNSSPQSYKLMPASAESSESDRTSFVEKSSHKFVLPVSYFLEIAKLWAISNRSELECQFTIAKTDQSPEPIASAQAQALYKDSQRPICHEKAIAPDSAKCPWSNNENPSSPVTPSAEQDLLRSINRFLESCRKKDKLLTGTEGVMDLSNNVGSETRRYLSQIISLMSKTFACKLVKQQNGLNISPEETMKQDMCDDLQNCKVAKEEELQDPHEVNVFTMSSVAQIGDKNEQLVIIHIPTCQKKKEVMQKADSDEPRVKRTRKVVSSGVHEKQYSLRSTKSCSASVEKSIIADQAIPEPDLHSYTCFYCTMAFADKRSCAKHMLSHLPSGID